MVSTQIMATKLVHFVLSAKFQHCFLRLILEKSNLLCIFATKIEKTMTKKTLLIPCAILALGLTSCMKDSYRHTISIAYPNPVSVVFGDQTADSIIFDTFDSYEVKSYQSEWIKVLHTMDKPSHATIQNTYYNLVRCAVDLQIEPNTTQKARNGYVSVRSYGNDWDQTGHAYYKQYGWHNVQKPNPVYKYDSNEMIESCTFESNDSALQTADTLRFVAYDNWTLDVEPNSFVKAPRTEGESGAVTLVMQVEPNATEQDRSTTMKLKSQSGVVTTVVYKQKAMKKEE